MARQMKRAVALLRCCSLGGDTSSSLAHLANLPKAKRLFVLLALISFFKK